MQCCDSGKEFEERVFLTRAELAELYLRITLKSIARGKLKRYFSAPLSASRPHIAARYLGGILSARFWAGACWSG